MSRAGNPFDEIATTYDRWYERPLGAYVERVELEALRACVEPHGKGGEWLELGAGTGRVAAAMLRLGLAERVVALEPSESMRAVGRRATEQLPVQWVDGVAESLPWPDESFDGALFFASIEFTRDEVAALAEVRRVVRGGHLLVVGHFEPSGLWADYYRQRASMGKIPWTRARWWSRDSLSKLLPDPLVCSRRALFLGPDVQQVSLDEDVLREKDRQAEVRGAEANWEVLAWKKEARFKP